MLLSLMNKEKSKKVTETEENLEDYGNVGLRTLLLCYKEIGLEDY